MLPLIVGDRGNRNSPWTSVNASPWYSQYSKCVDTPSVGETPEPQLSFLPVWFAVEFSGCESNHDWGGGGGCNVIFFTALD